MSEIPGFFEELEKKLASAGCGTPTDVLSYSHLVRIESWLEGGFADGVWVEREAAGEIWSDAIQTALDTNDSVTIPALPHPIYIDKPIVLHTGNSLAVHPRTEIRLRPGTNTCMLRNERLRAGQDAALPPDAPRDEGIRMSGGIWNAMNNGKPGGNGNASGGPDGAGSFIGAHGTFLFNSVRNLKIEGVTIIECMSHAVQLCNVSEFAVLDVSLPSVHRDGIHINAPADLGIVRGIRGRTGDDIVALNAWEWKNYAMAFGSISRILVEDVTTEPGYVWSEMRLLAGKKLFDGGGSLDCDIRNCFFRRLKGLHTVKIYSQPNLELGRELDYSGSVGYLEDIHFSDMEVDYLRPESYYCKKDAVFEVCADIQGLTIENINVNFPLGDEAYGNWKLIAVGPLSATCKPGSDDPSRWTEIFEPDAVCTVRGLTIADVCHKEREGTDEYAPCDDPKLLMLERRQTINEDYPHTTPRGGCGYGKIVK